MIALYTAKVRHTLALIQALLATALSEIAKRAAEAADRVWWDAHDAEHAANNALWLAAVARADKEIRDEYAAYETLSNLARTQFDSARRMEANRNKRIEELVR